MFDSPEELLQQIRLGEDTARNNLKDMRLHDPVLFYHSQQERAVVGIMEVTRRSNSDPTSAADPTADILGWFVEQMKQLTEQHENGVNVDPVN